MLMNFAESRGFLIPRPSDARVALLSVCLLIFSNSCATRLENAALTAIGSVAVADARLAEPLPRRLADNVGVAVSDRSDNYFLIIGRDDFQPGDPVMIIAEPWFPPAEIVPAKIRRLVPGDCSEDAGDTDFPFENQFCYELEVVVPEFCNIGFDMAVVNPASGAKVRGEVVSVDIDGDGKRENFRHCAGNESLAYSVWKGRPLKGRRIWSAYKHLNYDTEKTCTGKDYD